MKSPIQIQISDLSIAIGAKVILKNVNWNIQKGEHWLLTGNRATGKTALSQMLVGKHRVAAGSRKYPFLGENPTFEARKAAIQIISFRDTAKLYQHINDINYYQQRFNAFDSDGHLTVRQYLKEGGFDFQNKKHQELIATIGIEDLLDKDRIKLSSGQSRKMILAKVMITQPQVLVLDNPYMGLDKGSRQILNDLLDELVAQTGLTLILSGHFQSLPNCLTHRFHINGDGSFLKNTIQDFQEPPFSKNINETTLAAIKHYFQDKKYIETFSDIIRFENVNIKYGNTQILKNLDWRVGSGEKWAIIGQNGSGKSTVLSLVYGDNPQAYANQIYLFDKKRGQGESIWDIKRRIGFTSPELHAYFDEQLTAMKVVLTGLFDVFTVLRKPKPEQIAFAELLFDYFEISHLKAVNFNQLSTGTQRLLFFIRALVKVPQVLLLDEPFQGMDAETVFRCSYLMDEVLSEAHTLLFISHFQSEVPDSVKQELRL